MSMDGIDDLSPTEVTKMPIKVGDRIRIVTPYGGYKNETGIVKEVTKNGNILTDICSNYFNYTDVALINPPLNILKIEFDKLKYGDQFVCANGLVITKLPNGFILQSNDNLIFAPSSTEFNL